MASHAFLLKDPFVVPSNDDEAERLREICFALQRVCGNPMLPVLAEEACKEVAKAFGVPASEMRFAVSYAQAQGYVSVDSERGIMTAFKFSSPSSDS